MTAPLTDMELQAIADRWERAASSRTHVVGSPAHWSLLDVPRLLDEVHCYRTALRDLLTELARAPAWNKAGVPTLTRSIQAWRRETGTWDADRLLVTYLDIVSDLIGFPSSNVPPPGATEDD